MGSIRKWARDDNEVLYDSLFPATPSNDGDITLNDRDAALLLLRAYGMENFVRCNEVMYIYNKNTGMWTKDKALFHRCAMAHEAVIHEYSTDTTKYNKMAQCFAAIIPSDDGWIARTELTSLKKLLFTNGYLDMTTNTFHGPSDYSPNIVFTQRIDRPYVPREEIDEDLYRSLRQKIFYDIYISETVAKYIITNFARGLAGDIRMKKFGFGVGATNGGKGMMTTAIVHAVGGYASEFDAGAFIQKKENNGDSAKEYRWAYLLKDKRIIISNEVKAIMSGKDKQVFDGNEIKKHSSGGDCLTGRLHGGLETRFVPQYYVFCLCNDMPTIAPFDDAVRSRVEVVNHPFSFVETEAQIEIKDFHKVGDSTLKDTILYNDSYKDAILHILLDSWNAFVARGSRQVRIPEIVDAVTSWCEGDTLVGKFHEKFEITQDENDIMPFAVFTAWAVKEGFNMSATKLGIELRHLGVKKKVCTVGGKSKKMYTHIVFRDDNDS
jgi:phage/plasmid-associated DNA primase